MNNNRNIKDKNKREKKVVIITILFSYKYNFIFSFNFSSFSESNEVICLKSNEWWIIIEMQHLFVKYQDSLSPVRFNKTKYALIWDEVLQIEINTVSKAA
jgi:hypothetical protein